VSIFKWLVRLLARARGVDGAKGRERPAVRRGEKAKALESPQQPQPPKKLTHTSPKTQVSTFFFLEITLTRKIYSRCKKKLKNISLWIYVLFLRVAKVAQSFFVLICAVSFFIHVLLVAWRAPPPFVFLQTHTESLSFRFGRFPARFLCDRRARERESARLRPNVATATAPRNLPKLAANAK
jgi:hypothetical protein